MSFAELGAKIEAKRRAIVAEKKRAARKAKKASSKPIKKVASRVKTQTEWVGDPLDDPLPF